MRFYWKKYLNLANLSVWLSLLAIFFGAGLAVVYGLGPGKEYFYQKLPDSVLDFGVGLRNFAQDLKYVGRRFPENNLPRYELSIRPEDYKKMNDSLPDLEAKSKQVGYLSGIDDILLEENKVYVPAKFTVDGRTYEVEVRYRGGGFPHWSYAQKSLRIKFPSADLFNGQSQINLIIPLERGYLAEEFNNFRAKRLGLVVPDSRFTTVSVNGSRPSLYWEVGHYTKEFIESNGLSGEANVYSEDDFWQQQIYKDIGYWRKFIADPSQNKANFSEFNLLLSILNEPSDQVFYDHIFDILDKENFYAANIHNLLAGSIHQDYSHNLRTYFDKSVGKLKILPWDMMFYDNDETTLGVPDAVEASMNPLVQRIFKNPVFLRERNERLWRYLQEENNLREELVYFDNVYSSIQRAFYKDPIRSRSYSFFENFVLNIRQAVDNNFNRLRFLFTNAEASYALSNNLNDNNLTLEISHSDSLSPIYLDKLIFEFKVAVEPVAFDVYADGKKICSSDPEATAGQPRRSAVKCERRDLSPLIVDLTANEDVSSYAYKIFRLEKKKDLVTIVPRQAIDINFIDKVEIDIRNAYTGKKVKDIRGVFVDKREFADFLEISKLPSEFVAGHGQFYVNGKGEIVLPAGVYVFDKNVIVPRRSRLIINPGAQINLIKGASLVSYSPVTAKGIAAAPIVVRGEADGAGENFAVLDNDGLSEFEYVQFSGGGESIVNGAFFSGMLAIHRADSIIKYSRFANAKGDDALNIKYASSTIKYNTFADNFADALDYDLSDGVIEYNLFVGNGNDGIDTSGSPVMIRYNMIRNSGDKCISVGERSAPIVFNNVLNGCHIGVEVKDLSEPVIINNVIINNEIGINEYQKKEIFGGGFAKVFNTIVWDNKEQIILDKVSSIEVRNSAVAGGYKGAGNIDKKPVFLPDFGNDGVAGTDFSVGGDAKILKEFLGIDIKNAPIGLLYGI